MEMNKTEEKRFNPILMMTTGLFAQLFATSFARIIGLYGTGWDLVIMVLVYVGIACVVTVRSPNRLVVRLAIIYAMSPFGVILDTTVDFFVYHYDRNLWPIDVVILLVLLPVILMLGVITGRFVAHRRSK